MSQRQAGDSKRSGTGPAIAAASVFLILGLIVVVIVAGLIIYNVAESSRSKQASVIDSTIGKLGTPHRIVDQSFQVQALGFTSFQFDMPTGGKIRGNFRASGGKNDIEVVVFDARDFENFRNGNRARRTYYYSGGYVTSDEIDRDIPAGSYYLVFNNKDALITGKWVTAQIDVVY
jgi:hypothetical protein